MPIITVKLVEGKPEDQKQQLVQDITRVTVDAFKIEPERVVVLLEEIAPSCWARGGISMSGK